MKKSFIATAVLFCTAAVVFAGPMKKAVPAAPKRAPAPAVQKKAPAPATRKVARAPRPARARAAARPASGGGYRPAGTLAFAHLETIAQAVASIAGPKSSDVVLKTVVPNAIRGQLCAKLFGPMRPGVPGVAVCYVDPAIAARVAASRRAHEADVTRGQRWSVVYPTSLPKAEFLRRNPEAVPEANGSLRVPPGRMSRQTVWVWFSPDGQWAVQAPSPSMAAHAFSASAGARARPLGPNLAVMRMDSSGTRALFGSDLFANGELAIRLTPLGLELRGSAQRIQMKRPPLPAPARSLAGVPANATLFGVTTTPSDIHMAEDLFALAGPEFGGYVRNSLKLLERPGTTTLYLDQPGAPTVGLAPRARLAKILPESQTNPVAANSLFCSPTTVLRLGLPKVAAKMLPMDSVQLHVALRLLRSARGDGMGAMSWHDGKVDRLLVRISRDELYGTANLWSMLFL